MNMDSAIIPAIPQNTCSGMALVLALVLPLLQSTLALLVKNHANYPALMNLNITFSKLKNVSLSATKLLEFKMTYIFVACLQAQKDTLIFML